MILLDALECILFKLIYTKKAPESRRYVEILLLTRRCEDYMKEYVYSESCRILTIAKWFGCLKIEKESLCSCCDKCALLCECDCKDSLQYRLRINAKEISRNRAVPKIKNR